MKMQIISIAFSFFLLGCREESHRASIKKKAFKIEDTTLRWIDFRSGELPPVGYYDALDSTIRKWHIRYRRIEGGCEATPEDRNKYEKDNPKYFRILEKRFGKNWLERFQAEVKALSDQHPSLKHANQLRSL